MDNKEFVVGKQKSAKFLMSQELFFDLIGFSKFNGTIFKINIDNQFLEIFTSGGDDRLPEIGNIDFPECHVVLKQITSHFIKVNE